VKIFGFEVRRYTQEADPVQPPGTGTTTPHYAYTPEAKIRVAYRNAGVVLEHLMRGHSASREQMQRAGMSNRQWRRAVWLLQAAGVIAVTQERRSLELVVRDWAYAEELLDRARERMLRNVRSPRYTLPVE